MTRNRKSLKVSLSVSASLSAAMLGFGFCSVDGMTGAVFVEKLMFPLLRLMGFITAGLFAGQLIEAAGWTRMLSFAARPLFNFGRLGDHCSAAFITAFLSGTAANAMLLEFYEQEKISKEKLFLTNFVNQFPAYFLHLPTTFFIVLPLTGKAGALYFGLTFAATLLRTALFLTYGHFRFDSGFVPEDAESGSLSDETAGKSAGGFSIGKILKEKLPKRLLNIAVFVIPIYIAVFMFNAAGFFTVAREWMARYFAASFAPMESLSVVVVGFAAEFTSGFAAAGALMDAGMLTTKQTALALITGNIVAFPLRALRHQLPRYMGIFSPKMGLEILLMGQGFRIVSLIFIAVVFYYAVP
ncbi:MAG: nucleoside recognition protein [Desulfobacteraceae bacterium]